MPDDKKVSAKGKSIAGGTGARGKREEFSPGREDREDREGGDGGKVEWTAKNQLW